MKETRIIRLRKHICSKSSPQSSMRKSWARMGQFWPEEEKKNQLENVKEKKKEEEEATKEVEKEVRKYLIMEGELSC